VPGLRVRCALWISKRAYGGSRIVAQHRWGTVDGPFANYTFMGSARLLSKADRAGVPTRHRVHHKSCDADVRKKSDGVLTLRPAVRRPRPVVKCYNATPTIQNPTSFAPRTGSLGPTSLVLSVRAGWMEWDLRDLGRIAQKGDHAP